MWVNVTKMNKKAPKITDSGQKKKKKNQPCILILIFRTYHMSKSAVFHTANVMLILYKSSLNKKLILSNLHFRHTIVNIVCFCSILKMKLIPN